MSYAFDMLFVKPTMATEGDAMVYGSTLVKKIALNHDLAMKQIQAHPRTIANRLRMAGVRWGSEGEKKEALRSEAARLAIESAARIIFSQRMVYWPQHFMLAIVGDCIPDELKDDVVSVYFQNSADQDYEFDEWSDEIPLFWHEKSNILAMSEERLKSELDWASDTDYIRRSLMYQRIFDKLHLDNWLYRAREEQGFRVINVSGIISQEVELDLAMKIRAYIMHDRKYFDIFY